MKWRYSILIFAGIGCSAWGFLYRPFPLPGDDPMLDLVLYHTPNFYTWIVWWYYLAPAAAVIVGGLFLVTVWRVWFSSWGLGIPNIGMLPQWPLNPAKDAGPSIAPTRRRSVPHDVFRYVHLNAHAFWCNVPAAVWSYKLGGYQVLKKWLSYRERPILGRPLNPEEVQHFAEIARRIGRIFGLTGPFCTS